MEKTYNIFTHENGSHTYVVQENGVTRFTIKHHLSKISDTFFGAELKVFDDNWQYIKRNLWVLDIRDFDIEKDLIKAGFTLKERIRENA